MKRILIIITGIVFMYYSCYETNSTKVIRKWKEETKITVIETDSGLIKETDNIDYLIKTINKEPPYERNFYVYKKYYDELQINDYILIDDKLTMFDFNNESELID